ncbi:MAG: TRAP transporter large permease subunit, partial [Mailhella sp.]|nr:TRAP transporter large permease subunit [Mailhella sp.]
MAAELSPCKGGILNWLDRNFEKPILVIALLLSIGLITYQVIFRYIATNVFGIAGSTAEVEEFAVWCFVWLSYLAVPLVIKARGNINISIFVDAVPPRIQRMLAVLAEAVFLLFVCVLGYFCYSLSLMQISRPTFSPAMGLSYALPYAVLPVSFALMAIRLVQNLIQDIREAGILDSILAICFGLLIGTPVLMQWELEIVTVLGGTMLICLLLGVPIAVTLGFSAMAALFNNEFLSVSTMAPTCFSALDSFTIMSIFFFVASGVFMGAGGLSKQLIRLADILVGRAIGGMALATVVTCMFFAAICGSGPATVAAIGAITIPAMVERGYDKRFAAALVACAGSIGVVIPPSNPMVVFGVIAKASIGKLFIAGIIPGLMIGGVLMGYSYWISKKNDWRGRSEKLSAAEVIKAVWEAKWALMIPVIILGGIYGGFMTPTEAAAIAASYGLFVGVFIYKGINRKNFFSICVECCTSSAVIIFLIAMASSFGYLLALEQVPETIAQAILAVSNNKYVILLLINLFLLVVGALMEPAAATIILTPILAPIAMKLGVDIIHFGLVMTVN